MTVAVRGRVPRWANDSAAEMAAQHIQERLHALEVALARAAPQFVSPSTPTFGAGPVLVGGGGGGGGGSATPSITDHGLLSGLADDDHPQYVEHGESVRPHSHGPFDVSGLETRFVNRFERVLPPHTHTSGDILGIDQRQQARPVPHAHVTVDVADILGNAELVLAARIFGG